MRGLLPLIGVCALLIAVQIEAKEKNRRNFWDLWGSDSENTAPAAASDDFTLEDGEGSGMEKIDSTHRDDEDFDVGSGDEEVLEIKPEVKDDKEVAVDKPDYENDDDEDIDYYDNNGKIDKENKNKVSSDDEDLFDGSGSGDEPTEAPVQLTTSKPKVIRTTAAPLKPCENLRNSARSVAADFVPACTENGDFEKTQCTIDKKEKYCWCVNDIGAEINGTRMMSPVTPDCVGENLKSCVYQLVLHNQNLFGSYKPKCTWDGQFEPVQCQGSECWCVDADGNEAMGSLKNLPEIPDCSEKTTVAPRQTAKPVVPEQVMPDSDNGYEVKNPDPKKNNDTNIVVNIGPDTDDDMIEETEEETNEINEETDTGIMAIHQATVLGQPGLLAAIIGGAVVGLLCMVLLVMFIVYRMRKKDEGSYPLDEQKYQNYNYAKAPDKEFYA